jgi:hypothetical protein
VENPEKASACQTGSARNKPFEGLFRFTRALRGAMHQIAEAFWKAMLRFAETGKSGSFGRKVKIRLPLSRKPVFPKALFKKQSFSNKAFCMGRS